VKGSADVIPVLMYHGIHSDTADPGHPHPVYSVRRDDFVRQLDWLVSAGYQSVRLDEVGRPVEGNPIVVTFDDGDVSNVDVALPLLVERGLVAEFFVVSDHVGEPGWVRQADGRALVAAGMGVQSHSRTHRPLEDLSIEELEAELMDSRRALEKWAGTAVAALSLPGGRGRRRESETALRLGYTYVLGSVPGPNRTWTPGRCLQRIAITRGMSMSTFQALVEWNGIRPRRAWARYQALEGAKRLVGNSSYTRVRAMLLNARGTPLSAPTPKP
jgi:peptidoglycan/xylan/chitin deacetylase (PgdA/CDA1 family)